MPYIFPKRKLSTGDILDPIDLNDDILPSVELYSGEINEHNLTASGTAALNTLGDGNIASNAYYSFLQESRIIDPDFGNTAPFSMAKVTNITSADKVPNNGAWTAIPLNNAGDTSVTTTSDNAAIWVEASLQYAVSRQVFPRAAYSSGGAGLLLSLDPLTGRYLKDFVRLQFAIRLDGAVLPWTITGHRDPAHQSPRGEKPSVAYPIGKTSQGSGIPGELLPADPGPRIEHETDVGCLGNPYFCVRLGTIVNVTGGSHTLELVARRTPLINPTRGFDKKDIVSIYTRKLFAVQIPQVPRASSTFDSIEVVPFDSESAVTAATMTASVDAVRDKFNAVKDGALSRSALREQHLPSANLGTASAVRSSSAVQNVTTTFPGWGSSTQVGTSPIGWTPITSLTIDQTVANTIAGQASKVLVLADLHVTFCKRVPSEGNETDAIGAAAIALSTDGGTTYTVQEDSIVFFNGANRVGDRNLNSAIYTINDLQARHRDNLNIGLSHVINATSAGSTTYKCIVVCTTIPTVLTDPTGATPLTTVVQTQRGQISSVVLRD